MNRAPDTSKWAALLAVVFALGGGEAAAQPTPLTPDNTLDGNGLQVDVAERVAEGATATITVIGLNRFAVDAESTCRL